ncbi:riboflavin synthase subunit alpha [Xenophilus sp. AP218F]|nr:riboflavin synthase subunit alpha [Chromobacterium sp. ASV5]OWY40787.1 riboflavin synthase subunit alpha [Xenophilus sp. AP218F]
MFSGIVQGIARVERIAEGDDSRRLTLSFPAGFCDGLKQGASVAIDGVCLTVAAPPVGGQAEFDLILPTLITSTLAACRPGDALNVERAQPSDAENGGHALSGHVDYQATVRQIRRRGDNLCLRVSVPAGAVRYLFPKGWVALCGVSLTIADIDKQAGWLEVWLAPETRRATTLGDKQPDDRLNLEIERQTQVLVDTMREALEDKLDALLRLLQPEARPAIAGR